MLLLSLSLSLMCRGVRSENSPIWLGCSRRVGVCLLLCEIERGKGGTKRRGEDAATLARNLLKCRYGLLEIRNNEERKRV